MNRIAKQLPLFVVCIYLLTFISCNKMPQRSYWPTDEWKTARAESVGMDSQKIAGALSTYTMKNLGLHSLLVIRNGFVVVEGYGYPYTKDTLHNINSVTKSFTSSLYGIALEKGLVASIDSPMLNSFPKRLETEQDERKRKMTIQDILTMRTGLNWNEDGGGNIESSFSRMLAAEDCLSFILDTPMLTDSGKTFDYNTGASHILTALLEDKTGGLERFARQSLFSPLGIHTLHWKKDPQGIPMGGYGLSLTSRDMAKLGFLYLNKGLWDGKQIIPRSWVEEAVKAHTATPGSFSPGYFYGYQWWISPDKKTYIAQGYGGQNIFVNPELDLIIVTTAALNYRRLNDYYTLITQEIPASCVSAGKIPKNKEGEQALDSLLAAWASPPPAQAIRLPSAFAQNTDTVFVFDTNEQDLQSITITLNSEKGIIIRQTYQSKRGEQGITECIGSLGGEYRLSRSVMNEARYQFGDTPIQTACRLIESGDEQTLLMEIVPLGIVEGPFLDRFSVENQEITFTRINQANRRSVTLKGRKT